MKLIKITAAFLAVILMNTANAQGDIKEQLVVPLSQPGKPFKLKVELVNGSIKVITHEGKDVIIDADANGDQRKKEKRDRDNDRDADVHVNTNVNVNINGSNNHRSDNSGMKRIAPNGGLDISAEERNNSITLETDSYKRAVNLVIKVPVGESTIRLSTVNNGEISVTGVSGEFELSNINGAIYIKDISGSVVANTVNGGIIGNLKSIDPKAAMAFSTLNGKIDVTFPASLKANLKLQSDRGEMYTDFDMESDKSQPKVNKSSQSGLYKINVESWVYGKVNGGGPQVMMKTMNGNLYIRKAK